MSDPNPCTLFKCSATERPLDYCERIRQCPYAWVRRSREDRECRESRLTTLTPKENEKV